jgi:plastocyanin
VRALKWGGALSALLFFAACIDRGVDVPAVNEEVPEAGTPAPTGGGDVPTGGGGDEDCVSGPVDVGEADHNLSYASFAVNNKQLFIAAGEAVAWTNNDSVPHSVTAGEPGTEAADADFHADLPAGAAWAYRFCEPADYLYFCKPHEATMNDYHVVVE